MQVGLHPHLLCFSIFSVIFVRVPFRVAPLVMHTPEHASWLTIDCFLYQLAFAYTRAHVL